MWRKRRLVPILQDILRNQVEFSRRAQTDIGELLERNAFAAMLAAKNHPLPVFLAGIALLLSLAPDDPATRRLNEELQI